MNWLTALKSRLDLIQTGYKMKKDIAAEKRFTLEEALSVLDISITQTENSVKANSDTIDLKSKHLAALKTESIDTKRKISKYRSTILKYVTHVYSEWNSVYGSSGSIDIMKSLILSEWATDLILADMMYTTLVTELGQQFVTDYRGALKDYYLLSVQIQEEITSLQTLRENLDSQVYILSVQKKEREKLLEITKWQEVLFDSYLKAQQEAQETVETAWLDAQKSYEITLQNTLKKYGCGDEIITEESAEACHNVRIYFANEKKLHESALPTVGQNILFWPVAWRELTTYFHDTGYYNSFASQHDAIDIRSPQSTPVAAAAPGYAYYIVEPTPSGYSYLAIKHRDGFVTVYGHLSEVLVTEWQFVETGDIIAKSGGMPGTPGAGPMTTWPHLHFEVWKDRKPVNPLRYMSIAKMDFEQLPSVYEEKFIQDIVELSGNAADAFKYQRKFNILWATERERQEYLLKTYATPDFQDWNMWIDAGIDARVDPSFLICVWLAETTLGNYLKTSYNIWNVWNTDSGGTYDFASPTEWISWMGKTFNNKFLKGYTKISELSRWGNTDDSIYASSGGNWHNNIVKCLSALKGRFVEDDFKFRIND